MLRPGHRTYFGSPDDPIKELMDINLQYVEPPQVGDELCDGHQAHYEWVIDLATGKGKWA